LKISALKDQVILGLFSTGYHQIIQLQRLKIKLIFLVKIKIISFIFYFNLLCNFLTLLTLLFGYIIGTRRRLAILTGGVRDTWSLDGCKDQSYQQELS
jgi:hypothetical protein